MEPPNNLLRKLQELIFGHDDLFAVTPLSKAPGDDTIKVILCSIPTGQWLQDLDKPEEFFHIEFFAGSEGIKPRAEVWPIKLWRESNARRTRFRGSYEKERADRFKYNSRVQELAEDIGKQFPFSLPEREEFAKTMLKNFRNGNYENVIKVINVIEKLAKYAKEDEEENSRDNSGGK